MYPCLEIDLGKIKSNAEKVNSVCKAHGLEVMAVTKSYCAIPEVIRVIQGAGIKRFTDSRMQNIKRIRQEGFDFPIMLLRIPMLSEVEELVALAQMSLNSEIATVRRISEAAVKQGKTHGIIAMIDVGDLREGMWPDQVEGFVRECMEIPGIEVQGVATNFACFGGVLPSPENTRLLDEAADKIREMTGKQDLMVSVGGTVAFELIEQGLMPTGINCIRMGEGISMGTDASHEKSIDILTQDTMQLAAEIVEVKIKPSVPIGEQGCDAFFCKPVFEDKGMRKRAVCAIGKQDALIERLTCKDRAVEVLGGSSDHLIVDVTDSDEDYKVGDILRFTVDWANMLRLTTSQYVSKRLI